MLTTLLIVAALIPLAVWIGVTLKAPTLGRTVARAAVVIAAVVAVVALVTTSWLAAIVGVVATAVAWLGSVTSAQLSADRTPSAATQAILGQLGADHIGGGPLVGQLWEFPGGTYLIAAGEDSPSALEMWVRAAQVALRSAPEGTKLVAIVEGTERRDVTVAGTPVTITATTGLRALAGNRRGRRGARRR